MTCQLYSTSSATGLGRLGHSLVYLEISLSPRFLKMRSVHAEYFVVIADYILPIRSHRKVRNIGVFLNVNSNLLHVSSKPPVTAPLVSFPESEPRVIAERSSPSLRCEFAVFV
jgi:hypothetical protein